MVRLEPGFQIQKANLPRAHKYLHTRYAGSVTIKVRGKWKCQVEFKSAEFKLWPSLLSLLLKPYLLPP